MHHRGTISLVVLLIIWTLFINYAIIPDQGLDHDRGLKLVVGHVLIMGAVLVYQGYSWSRTCDDRWTLVKLN
ncbi:uncharacterized protein DEA37_0001553 [Paragonimus westermani]|uniref:SRCR domain-containing protein n=1 Tax=Paragonimus westermani TaxID=34504 RepID=A0A5J4NTJ5_9TREM|nr:uncharacterized protein DEA37_0001553 [Paragonimus westermani]